MTTGCRAPRRGELRPQDNPAAYVLWRSADLEPEPSQPALRGGMPRAIIQAMQQARNHPQNEAPRSIRGKSGGKSRV